jgi:hypothetical protein
MYSELFKQGLFDALGFLLGSLLGYGLGQLLSIDLFAPGYSFSSLLGISFIGIGGGMGLQASRFFLQKKSPPEL